MSIDTAELKVEWITNLITQDGQKTDSKAMVSVATVA